MGSLGQPLLGGRPPGLLAKNSRKVKLISSLPKARQSDHFSCLLRLEVSRLIHNTEEVDAH